MQTISLWSSFAVLHEIEKTHDGRIQFVVQRCLFRLPICEAIPEIPGVDEDIQP